MLPFLLVLLIGRMEDVKDKGEVVHSLPQQLYLVLKNPVFMFLVLGQGVCMFTTGGISFWGVDYFENYYGLDSSKAVIYFSGICVVAGIGGTFIGSSILDGITDKNSENFEMDTTCKSCEILVVSLSFALLFACKR